jgi:hypothetical protein
LERSLHRPGPWDLRGALGYATGNTPSGAAEYAEGPEKSAPKVAAGRRPTIRLSPENPPFFVVGHGRSGTTWSERLLNSHPEVLCKGSGMFFGRNRSLFETQRTLPVALANCEGLKTWHDMQPNYWSDRSLEEDLPGMVRAIADHIMGTELERSGKKIVGDRTPHHVTCMDEIREFYPDSKVIHVIRDGRDVAISNLHAFWNSARDRGGPVDLEPEEIERLDAYLKDRDAFLASGESIFSEARLNRLSTGWKNVVSKGRRDGERLFGGNYIEIRYENLLDDPQPELERLFGFLGVGAVPSMIERIVEENRFEKRSSGRRRGEEDITSFFRKGIKGDWEKVYNDRDRRIFKENTGELLVLLGYEDDLKW